MPSNSIYDHTKLVIKQIRLLPCGGPILLFTRVITDRIGLHSVLHVLPLLIMTIIMTKFSNLNGYQQPLFEH